MDFKQLLWALFFFYDILEHSWWISLCLKVFIFFFKFWNIFFYSLKFIKSVDWELLFFFLKNSKKFWNLRKKYVNSLRKSLTTSIKTVKFIILWISIGGYLILNSPLNIKGYISSRGIVRMLFLIIEWTLSLKTINIFLS